MTAQFPNVPLSPGVPPVRRQGVTFSSTVGNIVALTSDAVQVIHALTDQRWGLFPMDAGSGAPTITGDNVEAVEVRQEQRIADYPLEDGGFASYNKVQEPLECRVSFTFGGFTNFGTLGSLNILGTGGGDSARASFLQDIDAACKTLALYTVQTREMSYPNLNVMHYDYRRTASKGATLLTVDIWCREVRVIGVATSSNTQNANAASQANGGTVQPVSSAMNTPGLT